MAGQRTDGRRPAGSLRFVLRLATLLGLLGIPSGAWARQADPVAVAARVADAVCGKQVVLLGELPSHGEAIAPEKLRLQHCTRAAGDSIARANGNRGTPRQAMLEPLGARLAEQWGERLAAVGFTAYAGWSSMAGQPRRPLEEAPPGSLEARATGGDVPWVFLTAADLRRLDGAPSRLLGPFGMEEWSTLFDGVVVIREEVAPVFDEWSQGQDPGGPEERIP